MIRQVILCTLCIEFSPEILYCHMLYQNPHIITFYTILSQCTFSRASKNPPHTFQHVICQRVFTFIFFFQFLLWHQHIPVMFLRAGHTYLWHFMAVFGVQNAFSDSLILSHHP